MAMLSEDVKRFIVESLACDMTPSEVSEAVNLDFGLDVPRQQVEKYDPTKQAGLKLSGKWRVVYEETRSKYRAQIAEVTIANRVFRLRSLQSLFRAAKKSRNIPLAAQMLEQAAKEVGNMFVNLSRAGDGAAAGGDAPPPTSINVMVNDARRRPD
jgi:hypothetical protein